MKKKTKIHLVRHGEVHNPTKIIYGRIPGFFLSETGRKQVERLGNHISSFPIRAIYASPLDRTKETASILARYFPNTPVNYDERLLEVYSPVQGQPIDPFAIAGWNFYTELYITNGGESLQTIYERMQDFLDEKTSLHDGEEILVVSHGDPLMIVRAVHNQLPLEITSLLGENYIPTAHGFSLIVDNVTASVEEIIPGEV